MSRQVIPHFISIQVPDDDQKQVYTLAYSFGLNEAGQLGLGDEGRDKNRKVPTLIHDLKGVNFAGPSLSCNVRLTLSLTVTMQELASSRLPLVAGIPPFSPMRVLSTLAGTEIPGKQVCVRQSEKNTTKCKKRAQP